MDRVWVGRKLGVASDALAARFAWEWEARTGECSVLGPVVGSFLRELGRWLALGEEEPGLPLSRACGVLRIPRGSRPERLERELAELSRLVRGHVARLPGATRDIDQRLRLCFRHGAHAVAYLHRAAMLGVGRPRARRVFGGLSVVRFTPREQDVELLLENVAPMG